MNLRKALTAILPAERVLTRDIDRIAYASDASFYRLVPRAVVQPTTIEEVQHLFALSRSLLVPLVFRAAGTSLSGQSVTDGILVHIGKHWKRAEVLDSGKRMRVEPGVVGAYANRLLRPYGAKLGPDPASINSCMMGGILANNSSGMCCGVAQNSYHTVESLVFVLPDGTVVDTSKPDADSEFVRSAPAIAQGLVALREKILSNAELQQKIRAKYRTKNTTGYSLNAFLDFERPVDIMRHALIGSEGTLGFIAEAVLYTVPELPLRYTGLLFFATIADACAAIEPLRASGAAALELFDGASLRAVQYQPGAPAEIAGLPLSAAAILVEYQAASEAERDACCRAAQQVCTSLALLHAPAFTANEREQAALWTIRKGLLPSVGAVRASGSTVIIEDVAFPVESLANAVTDLQTLFAVHGYNNAIVFGHAKDGNIHFVMTQSFGDANAVERYERFTDDLVSLVVQRYGGALKAEHGTGRNMAPFVETEWGADAYAVMQELKSLVDPLNLLNPGVIINGDPRAHLADLKTFPPVEHEVDMCTECGYCEQICPSRNLTTTPRQRIVVRREIARLDADGLSARQLRREYEYDGLDTCATDGLCSVACPVGINTGDLVKRLRAASQSPFAQQCADGVARNFAAVELGAKAVLHMGHAAAFVGASPVVNAAVQAVERLAGVPLPKWSDAMPKVRREGVPTRRDSRAEFVYFPSCVSRVMGGEPHSAAQPLIETLMLLCHRAGVHLALFEEPRGLCCGMPFFSKGFPHTGAQMQQKTVEALLQHTDNGRLPVVVDSSSCTLELLSKMPEASPLSFVDVSDFVLDVLLQRLPVVQRLGSVAVHPVCSLRRMHKEHKLVAIARACAEHVVVPASVECCAMAGDRGLLFPELTHSAVQPEVAELASSQCDMYVSSNIPCEIAMSSASGQRYMSVLYLVEQATRPVL